MTKSRRCLRCQAPLTDAAALDVCPRCLAHQLLNSDESVDAGSLPDVGAAGDGGGDPQQVTQVHQRSELGELVGDRVGPYKLLQKLGEGGFGVVFMAEQLEPVRRRVALKIIKLGMDTRQLVARFEAERQALAMMDHPHIARVLDAGATESGRPYFVMELVRGVPIHVYCDDAQLATSERLRLFVQVCRAVQHAHQKGIVHRDLKPGNILVTINDGVTVPKVIDFGIAKAVAGQPLTDKTLFTAFEQFIGTPAYMSPEQAMMTSLDIDTRSDIYSLGVLLYELLTGKTPFRGPLERGVGLESLRRTIVEQEATPPSALLKTIPDGDLSTVAQRRSTDPPRLIESIRGDLDWIVMKCLEKDRQRRYETASGLAADIERHLADEPVIARPPSRLYRFSKAYARNRLTFTAAACVLVALLLGFSITLWQLAGKNKAMRLAQAAAEKARQQAARSEQVVQLLKDMLHGAGPLVAMGRDTTILREILDTTAGRLETELKDQPEVEAELSQTLSWVYEEIGETEKAEKMMLKALALHQQVYGLRHEKTAVALNQLGTVLHSGGKHADSERLIREAIAIRRQHVTSPDVALAWYLSNLSNSLLAQGKVSEAEQAISEAVNLKRQLLSKDDVNLAMSLVNQANVLSTLGRTDAIEAALHEALAIFDRLPEDQKTGGPVTLQHVAASNLADMLEKQQRWREAEPLRLTAAQAAMRVYGSTSRPASSEMIFRAGNLMGQGRSADADQLMESHLATITDPLVARRYRALWNAMRTKWDVAIVDARWLIEQQPDEHERHHDLVPLLAVRGDIDGYRRQCRLEVERFRDTEIPFVAERMAKDCCILPDSGADPEVLNRWAQVAIERGEPGNVYPWFRLADSMVQLRAQRWESASQIAHEVLDQPIRDVHRDAQAAAIWAMAARELGRNDEAERALERAEQLTAGLVDMSSGYLGPGWIDRINVHLLLQEARARCGAR